LKKKKTKPKRARTCRSGEKRALRKRGGRGVRREKERSFAGKKKGEYFSRKGKGGNREKKRRELGERKKTPSS